MFKVTKYPHGTFSSADCSTTDWESAKRFYQSVMGWEAEDLPLYTDVKYTRFKQDGETVATLIPLPDEAGYTRSHWKCFITVDDVDALAEKVTALGGTVVDEPFDALNDGRMMVIKEPTGATVALWQAKEMIGVGLVNTAGAMLWNEFLTHEPQKTMDFFGELLGWAFKQDGERNYYMILNQGRMNGGILGMDESMSDMPSQCMVYYNVADLDDTLEKVKSGGGAVHMRGNAEDVGRFAVVADPQGASFYVMQADNPELWIE